MRLNQVTVLVSNVAQSIKFYEKLGLELIVKSPDYARFLCPDGDATFSIHLTDKNIESNTVIYFECDNIDERYSELKASGLFFESAPTDQPWLWREADLKDPDGNLVKLYLAGTNRKNPPWRIKTQT